MKAVRRATQLPGFKTSVPTGDPGRSGEDVIVQPQLTIEVVLVGLAPDQLPVLRELVLSSNGEVGNGDHGCVTPHQAGHRWYPTLTERLAGTATHVDATRDR